MSIVKQSIIDIWNSLPHRTTKGDSKRLGNLLTADDRKWMEDNHLTVRQIVYLLSGNCTAIPVCKTCGGPVDFAEGRVYCSIKCARQDKEVQEKANTSSRKTCLERYGAEHISQVPEILAKARSKAETTNIARYGSKSTLGCKEVQEKARRTCIKRYGVENAMQLEEVKEKVKATCLEKYGTEWAMQSDAQKQRQKETCKERYGTEWASQGQEVKAKREKTCRERYGASSFFASKAFKASHSTDRTPDSIEKGKQTCLERYGCTTWTQTDEARQRLSKAISISRRERSYEVNKKALSSVGIELLTAQNEYAATAELEYRCLHCGLKFRSPETNVQRVHCPSCIRRHWSLKEKEIVKWIKTICAYEVVENDRKQIAPYELDIYIPERNLAIEFNGTYWHSSEWKSKSYHLDKTIACRQKGIRLIHVFEWEWNINGPLVKSLIGNALGMHSKTIYARNCEVKEMRQSDYRAFLTMHHLQGSVNSSIRLGLFFQNEPIMVAGWGRSRFNSKEMELHRLCTKEGMNVIGGFSKLIAHSGLDHFISYVDRAHFTGDGYLAVGFTEIGSTPPGYRWVNENGDVVSRQQAQKAKLPKLLGEAFDPELTEVQNMTANGWVQMFDCGNLKMEWNRPK